MNVLVLSAGVFTCIFSCPTYEALTSWCHYDNNIIATILCCHYCGTAIATSVHMNADSVLYGHRPQTKPNDLGCEFAAIILTHHCHLLFLTLQFGGMNYCCDPSVCLSHTLGSCTVELSSVGSISFCCTILCLLLARHSLSVKRKCYWCRAVA